MEEGEAINKKVFSMPFVVKVRERCGVVKVEMVLVEFRGILLDEPGWEAA